MKAKKKIKCSKKDKGKRLDIFLMGQIGSSRSVAQKKIKESLVLVNDIIKNKTGYILKEDDVMEIKEKMQEPRNQSIGVAPKLISETDDYIIIDKPAGLLTHPTEKDEPDTLTSWILENYPNIKGVGEKANRPGIVHRLDRDASGVMVIAKTQPMFKSLKEQFKTRTVEKEYNVLVHNSIDVEHDLIDFDINRGTDGRMAARPKIDALKLKNVGKEQIGRGAITEFWVARKFARFTFLKVKLHSGRTHQIRVHMLAYNHPVVGDTLYYNKKLNRKRDKELGRLFLHAIQLCFDDLTGRKVCYDSDIPKELNDFLEKLN